MKPRPESGSDRSFGPPAHEAADPFGTRLLHGLCCHRYVLDLLPAKEREAVAAGVDTSADDPLDLSRLLGWRTMTARQPGCSPSSTIAKPGGGRFALLGHTLAPFGGVSDQLSAGLACASLGWLADFDLDAVLVSPDARTPPPPVAMGCVALPHAWLHDPLLGPASVIADLAAAWFDGFINHDKTPASDHSDPDADRLERARFAVHSGAMWRTLLELAGEPAAAHEAAATAGISGQNPSQRILTRAVQDADRLPSLNAADLLRTVAASFNLPGIPPPSDPPQHPFIAVEGVDGVGKTTIARMLAEALNPGPLITGPHWWVDPESCLVLTRTRYHAIDCDPDRLAGAHIRDKHLFSQGILTPQLASIPVICDRWVASACVYAHVLHGVPIEAIASAFERPGVRVPDLCILVKCDAGQAASRLAARAGVEPSQVWDHPQIQARLQASFETLLTRPGPWGRRVLVIENSGSKADLAHRVRTVLASACRHLEDGGNFVSKKTEEIENSNWDISDLDIF